MGESGRRPRPGRILIVAAGSDLDRVLEIIVREGHLVEATRSVSAAVKRLEQLPPAEIVLVGGLPDVDRARVMAAARKAGVWSAYLKGAEELPLFTPEERSHLLATIDCRADDARVAKAIGRLLDARRHPGEANGDEEDVG